MSLDLAIIYTRDTTRTTNEIVSYLLSRLFQENFLIRYYKTTWEIIENPTTNGGDTPFKLKID